ncbi:MAG: hemolysin III family protein [Acetanaerobacterium sp.]
MYRRANDQISFLTHFIGALMGVAGLIYILAKPFIDAEITVLQVVASLIFCTSMIALYSASAAYHYTDTSKGLRTTLRKLDHSMIYVLIAGTYTPVCLVVFSQPKGAYFCAGIWGVALLGVLLKVLWIDCPRFISVVIYLSMGWALLLDLPALSQFSFGGRLFLILGGVFYTIGAVIYGTKRPKLFAKFGFHELFHLFVLLGSAMHFIMVALYIL